MTSDRSPALPAAPAHLRLARLVCLAALLALVTAAGATPRGDGDSAAPLVGYRALPLAFEPNLGQVDEAVSLLSRGPGYTFFLTGREMVFSLAPSGTRGATDSVDPAAHGLPDPAAGSREVLRVRWLGGRRPASVEGLKTTSGVSHYLSLDGSRRATPDVPRYERVALRGVYPGVDLVVYGNQGRLEYDFLVAPGADPRRVRLGLEGAEEVTLAEDGALDIGLATGSARFDPPVAYQVGAAGREPVAARYALAADGHEVRFELGPHDPTRPLVIDPIFVYSTYLGSSGFDVINGMTLDDAGHVYVVGTTDAVDFPVVDGLPAPGGKDVFVAKLTADGANLLYSTYLGGTGDDYGHDLALDSSGHLWVVGYSTPGTPDAFVLELDITGNSFLFVEQLSGFSGSIEAHAVAIDGNDNVFVTGLTHASNFPTVNAFQPTYGGDGDAFLRKYSPTGTVLFSTYIGGPGAQQTGAVAIGSGGDVYVAGSSQTTDPAGDVAVLRLNNAGSNVVYATVFGGTGEDRANGIAVDGAGNAYVAGMTRSSDFPVLNALHGTFEGTIGGGWLARLDGTGSPLFSTYLEPTGTSPVYDVTLGADGSVHLAGSTDRQTQSGDQAHAYHRRLDAAATGNLSYSIFGGPAADYATALEVDADGDAYVAGATRGPGFPATAGAYAPLDPGGTQSGFVVAISPADPEIAIGNGSVAEGDFGTRQLELVVTLTEPSPAEVTVGYATADGTATAGSDYTATSGTLTFAPGEISAPISVEVLGDDLDEANETFTVTLSNPANATIDDGLATGTITDDDPSPSLSVGNCTAAEGDTGTTACTFTIVLSAPSGRSVTVGWATGDASATAGSDYTAATGSRTFAPGQTSRTFAVQVLGDGLDEPDETFVVTLSDPVNATIDHGLGIGTITDDDPPPSLSVGDCTATEGNTGTTDCIFTVALSAPSGRSVTVTWATADATATAGSDYAAAADSLTFSPGQTSKAISVQVLGDSLDEPDETFVVALSSPGNATIDDGQGTGTITDDDPPPSLSVGDCTVAEGNGGTTDCVFDVSLSAPSARSVTVSFATADATATAGEDYAAAADTLTFSPGETSQTVAVTVLGDYTLETDETFRLDLSSPGNATITDGQGLGTIEDDDLSLLFGDGFEEGLGRWDDAVGG